MTSNSSSSSNQPLVTIDLDVDDMDFTESEVRNAERVMNSGRTLANSTSYPDVYHVAEDSDISGMIDLCDSDFSDDDIEELSNDEVPVTVPVSFGRPNIPPGITYLQERLRAIHSGDFDIFHGVPDGRMSDIFARIQERIRSQALIIDRMSMYQLQPQVSPCEILSKLRVRKLTSSVEVSTLGACPICLEEYRLRMSVYVIPGCEHLVHKPCMNKWITQSYRHTCPLDNLPINVSVTPHVDPITPVEIAHAVFPTNPNRRSRTNSRANLPLRRSSRLIRRIG